MALEKLSREIKEKLAARHPVPDFTPTALQLS